MRLSHRAFFVAIAIALLLAGCGPRDGSVESEEPARTADRDATIVIPVGVDFQGVNELLTPPTQLGTAIHYFALFRPLLDEDPDFRDGPPTFKPLLAESWEFSDDRLTLTMTLRDDAVWSDGEPIDADDVRFTWQAQTAPEVGWINAEVKERIRDVEVVDPHTVRFHFTEAYMTQLLDVNLGVILPQHAWGELPFAEWRESGQWFQDHLVVSGPFELEDWQPAQRIILRRNERYFEEGLPRAARVVFEVTPERATQLARLRSGAAHFVAFVRPVEAASIEEDPDLRLLTTNTRAFFFIVWNTTRPPFDDPAVRRAMALAIDRQAIVDSLFYGYAKVPASPLPADVWLHDDSIEPWPYDPERAQEILAERGWTDSDGDGVLDRDGEPLRFELVTNADNDLRRDVITQAQAQLKRIGVDCVARTMEFNALLEPLQTQQYDAAMQALGLGTDLSLREYFHSDAAEGGLNWAGFRDAEVDRVLDEIETTLDPDTLRERYATLQGLLHEKQPLTLVYASQSLAAARETLRDAEPDAVSPYHHLARWHLVEDGGADESDASSGAAPSGAAPSGAAPSGAR